MCETAGTGTLRSEVPSTLLSQYIPPALRYACSHWIDHAEHGEVGLDDEGQVYTFLFHVSPFWLETMYWIGKVTTALEMLRKLGRLVKVRRIHQLSESFAYPDDVRRRSHRSSSRWCKIQYDSLSALIIYLIKPHCNYTVPRLSSVLSTVSSGN